MRSFWSAVWLGLLAAFGGAACSSPGPTDPARLGPFFHPRNFTGAPRLPANLRRVVLLPVHGGDLIPRETAESLDPILLTALQNQQRFEVVVLSREECEKSFGSPDLSSAAALPRDFLATMAQKFDAQAVMFVDLTTYTPYRPLAIGIRAKLADVATKNLIWSFDETFNTNNPAVANSLRHFYVHNDRGDVPFDMSTDALQSPGRFAAYAADAAFHTLPAP